MLFRKKNVFLHTFFYLFAALNKFKAFISQRFQFFIIITHNHNNNYNNNFKQYKKTSKSKNISKINKLSALLAKQKQKQPQILIKLLKQTKHVVYHLNFFSVCVCICMYECVCVSECVWKLLDRNFGHLTPSRVNADECVWVCCFSITK